MANKKSSIEIQLTGRDVSLGSVINKGRAAIKAFNSETGGSSASIASLRSQVVQLAGAFAGLSAIADVGAMLKQADQNAYGLAASIQAANREFEVGSAAEWESTIAEVSQKLRIYSQSDVKGAAAATIDMTKRLGLNAQQMRRVIELSGDLAVGRTDIAGAVERVTSALRGEAEASEFLGLTLNETYVKGWYEAHGAMQGAWKDLNDLQKAQVRYNVFLEQAIPLQGKAAASVSTYSGALKLINATVADSIGTNADLVAALTEVAAILRENAGAIGSFAGEMARGAAGVISFVAANRELLIDIAKYGAVFLLGSSAVLRLLATVRGLNAAFAAMTGLGVVQWMQQVLAAGNSTAAGLLVLRTAFVRLSVAAAAFFAAYQAGEWLTMRKAIEGTAQAQAELERTTKKVDQEFRKISESTGVVVTSMDELDRAVQEGRIHYERLTGTWKAGAYSQAAATLQTASTMKQVTGSALDEMKKQYKSYADTVKKLQESIAEEQRTASEEMRNMARSGMDDEDAWRDRKKEAQEYITMAQLAANAGKQMVQGGNITGGNEQFKLAAEYAAKAQTNFKGLNEEVKRGDTVIMTQAAALQVALQGYKQASDLKTSIMQQQSDALSKVNASLDQQAGGQLSGAVDAAKNALSGLSAVADEVKGKVQSALQEAFTPPEDGDWGKVWDAMESGSSQAATAMTSNWDRTYDQFLASGSEAIDKLESKLQNLVKDRNIKVYVEEVQQHAQGGLIHRFARGGKLPGYGGGDRISALLEAGEYVIRKEAVAKFGPALFHALNNLRLPEIPKFAFGGPVGFAAGGPATPSEIHALDISLGGNYAGRMTGSPIDVRKIKSAFQRAERLRS